MASKKQFEINSTPVYDTIAAATAAPQTVKGPRGTEHVYTPQQTATPEERAERAAAGRTQGRKGCKLPRINFALNPDTHEFLKVMGGITGLSMTGVINLALQEYRERHEAEYQEIKTIKDRL